MFVLQIWDASKFLCIIPPRLRELWEHPQISVSTRLSSPGRPDAVPQPAPARTGFPSPPTAPGEEQRPPPTQRPAASAGRRRLRSWPYTPCRSQPLHGLASPAAPPPASPPSEAPWARPATPATIQAQGAGNYPRQDARPLAELPGAACRARFRPPRSYREAQSVDECWWEIGDEHHELGPFQQSCKSTFRSNCVSFHAAQDIGSMDCQKYGAPCVVGGQMKG
ncbi:serine/arginine repetitive matrix protein 1-like [Panicum virgatum]|uniref:serine/arginine repetitive matrix protein 1-like n=1 Tax=Panicum virgatum TaxID=38727 RepID=UPI0019D63FC7|nr:serine/arginine repetitive matrix protein 1-like [Panicum virgatum]